MTTTASDDQLEALDRELLNAVQWDFPLDPRPFAVLGFFLHPADVNETGNPLTRPKL